VSQVSSLCAVNRIFYGAAGTGKTYHLQQLQQHYTEQLTQQDQATFLAEKLRDLTWRDVIGLVLLDEQRLLRVPEIVGHPYFRAKVTASNRTDNINQTVWGTLMRHTPAESTTVKYALKRRADLALFDKDDAGLWYLLDPKNDSLDDLKNLLTTLKRGAQPTEIIERFGFVTFHQSYGYEDFIEGLRPVLNDDSDDGQVRYEIRRGVFVELCERARRDPEHGYALFIDEINRGNVSKILGELITLIELDKREGAPNAIRVRLPYSGDWFSVPANVSIYGSMNSADRSLTPLDTALRRRFEFVEIMPDPKLLAGRVIEGVALDELLTVMNARIELLLGRDCLLGHAYFYPMQCFADLQTVMQQKIVPQLQEYFFDDWRKIRWVLNDHRKPAALQLIHEHDPHAQMLALFGEELDVPMQPTYALNSSAFAQIDSYRMILSV
jgi:5-methylcytosine-specific restriction enzyme B